MSSTKRWSTGSRAAGWAVGLAAFTVYVLTLEQDLSWWDCGEFIATSYGLEVGHPPGSPLYSLLSHLFMMLGAGLNDMLGLAKPLAWWSNLLSALAGGYTASMLYWTLMEAGRKRIQNSQAEPGQNADTASPTIERCAIAAGAAMIYALCDTAWFSAVESEVYSLAMAVAATMIWGMTRWSNAETYQEKSRWLVLECLLTGLGLCVHLLCMLALPAMGLVVLLQRKSFCWKPKGWWALGLMMLLVGSSPYLIVPIRAAADTPINSMGPCDMKHFKSYVARDHYEKAPLWPRMWKKRPNSDLYNAQWSRHAGEWEFLATYQIGYMYGRYLFWNFAGRYNDRQGYGGLQNGQFITGIPPIDKALVGTSAAMPESLPRAAHNRYFLIPLLIGIFGASRLYSRDRRLFWSSLTLFLTSGLLLAVYLNTPAYEPRERDYAYVLSFYAFALWTGCVGHERPGRNRLWAAAVWAAVILMGVQNWDDHDRSGRLLAHDASLNLLNSCDQNAVLFTLGDNDTFPLWCLQQVDGKRQDVEVCNITLMGTRRFHTALEENLGERPIFCSHYAQQRLESLFPGCLQLQGNAYKVMEQTCDSVGLEPSYDKVMHTLGWKPVKGVYVDEISTRFIEQYWKDVLDLADGLESHGYKERALEVVEKTLSELPAESVQNPAILVRIAKHEPDLQSGIRARIENELRYYSTVSESLQPYLVNQVRARQEALSALGH